MRRILIAAFATAAFAASTSLLWADLANAYTCTTTCFGNTCTTSCF